MPLIDKLASVHPDANLAENVKVGPFTVIEAGAVLGSGTIVGPHAYITSFARIGENVKIHNGAVVGTNPQDLKFEGEDTTLEIGDRTVVREFATLNRGTNESGKTTIGSDTFIMAYAHVAHDCHIGNNVILANSVNLAGHVEIDDWAIIAGLVPVHQFTRIGKHVMISGGRRVLADVPPFVMAGGDPLIYKGLNVIGLRRRGFNPDERNDIKQFYKLLYRSGLNFSQAIERIKEEMSIDGHVKEILEFVEDREKRSLMRGH